MLNKIMSLISILMKFNKINHKAMSINEDNKEIIVIFENSPPSVLTDTLTKCDIEHDIDNDTLFIYFI